MTEAELIELINKKRNELEEKRSARASSKLLEDLEDEIEKLAASLSRSNRNTEQREKQVFLDECAG